ncbi:MAG: hypothetical protein DBX52_02415 [Clostridiales bacterium]|nr:MAG: hypothetical protein DBX52_02415 [Clostridiales bacterium]
MQFKSFCAANSGEGFLSFFDTLLDEKNQNVYYIKGGPGSGKSTLLKEIASRADDAELVLCSGDPASLDGVILPEQQAVIIDATAPHSHEPRYPGVGGNLIDLGEGWDPEKMNRSAIMKLCDQKSRIYKECYALLKSAKSIQEGVFGTLLKQIPLQRIHTAGDKILRQNALWEKRERPVCVRKRYLSGISPEGRMTHSETFLLLGRNVIILEDRWMQSSLLLQYLDQRLNDNGIDHINGYHPLFGEPVLQHLIIPEASLSIVSKDGLFPIAIPEENIVKKISMQAMISREYLEEHKNKLAFIKRLEREILNLASEKLEEARSVHMEIEREYAKGTDFEATAHLKQKLINNIFART